MVRNHQHWGQHLQAQAGTEVAAIKLATSKSSITRRAARIRALLA